MHYRFALFSSFLFGVPFFVFDAPFFFFLHFHLKRIPRLPNTLTISFVYLFLVYSYIGLTYLLNTLNDFRTYLGPLIGLIFNKVSLRSGDWTSAIDVKFRV